MHTQQNYQDVRHLMRPGDIIAFGGTSLFSRWAKLTTRSVVTHVAVVMQTQMKDAEDGRFFNQIIEATDYNGKSGVMVNRLSERVNYYPGDIWWLPLGERARGAMDQNKAQFFDFLFKQKHKKYDIMQLFGSAVDATDDIPLLRKFSQNSEDFSSWFCSELVAEALEVADVLWKLNASEVTPIDVCRFNLYEPKYVQLKGDMKKIRGYNSINAEQWDAD